jgi:hypothetical protein
MTTAAPIAFPVSHEAKTRLLAARVGVSHGDMLAFLDGVRFWMDRGLCFELAVQRHAQTMREGCALAMRAAEA